MNSCPKVTNFHLMVVENMQTYFLKVYHHPVPHKVLKNLLFELTNVNERKNYYDP